jgi:hypothetical protein
LQAEIVRLDGQTRKLIKLNIALTVAVLFVGVAQVVLTILVLAD